MTRTVSRSSLVLSRPILSRMLGSLSDRLNIVRLLDPPPSPARASSSSPHSQALCTPLHLLHRGPHLRLTRHHDEDLLECALGDGALLHE